MAYQLAEQTLIPAGFERIYVDELMWWMSDHMLTEDEEGRRYLEAALWNCENDPEKWGPEVRYLVAMGERLRPQSEDIRKVRAYISSLTPCAAGLPVGIVEILRAIGRGRMDEPTYWNGCWSGGNWWENLQPQADQPAVMRTIHSILIQWRNGESLYDLIATYPEAKGFINRVFEWLGNPKEFSEIQDLMLERFLLPFDLYMLDMRFDPNNKSQPRLQQMQFDVFEEAYGPRGRGQAIDQKIARLAGLPPIKGLNAYSEIPEEITDPLKRRIYRAAGLLAHGLHTTCDCHHSTFRWLENHLYAIGQLRVGVPTHQSGQEGERIGRLLFGYLYALDCWLKERPEGFVLMDLDHVDLGFDIKNEIVTAYAYLREKTPVKEWLVGCLWYAMMYATGGLAWGRRGRHRELVGSARQKGLEVNTWMQEQLNGEENL